ncbi:hypothetical protein GDO81_028294 [Engystomops pustulosus]|uniref:Uncharacterized protein n=1 Tax=Engystomops pustulosus TaxID=76066 RepID=A0AAV6YKR5_ENGPU|nr:hypothetical protein GDO81_028294 [Engystomops pustulosus]
MIISYVTMTCVYRFIVTSSPGFLILRAITSSISITHQSNDLAQCRVSSVHCICIQQVLAAGVIYRSGAEGHAGCEPQHRSGYGAQSYRG